MSVILTVWTNEGIVMGSDSRISYNVQIPVATNAPQQQTVTAPSGHYLDNQYKTFDCPNGCGISSCGDIHLTDPTTKKLVNIQVYIERYIANNVQTTTSVFDTANNLFNYIRSIAPNNRIVFIVAGYNNGTPEVYNFDTSVNQVPVNLVNSNNVDFGMSWNGEIGVLRRLFRSMIDAEDVIDAKNSTVIQSSNTLFQGDCIVIPYTKFEILNPLGIPWNLISLQDVIDVVRYGIATTIDAQRFASGAKTVGGPIDILAIKPNGKASWVAHKELH